MLQIILVGLLTLALGACHQDLGGSNARSSAKSQPKPINVMGPLVIGDPRNPDQSLAEWREFEAQLAYFKKAGIESVTTDVWWGLVEPANNQF